MYSGVEVENNNMENELITLQYLIPLEEARTDATCHKFFKTPLTVSMVGAGYKGGQPKTGVEKGPGFLRSRAVGKNIEWQGWSVVDIGDVVDNDDDWSPEKDPPTPSGIKNPRRVGAATQQLYQKIKNADPNHMILTLGGDHSFALGSISALLEKYKDLSIVWVDAHGDINTPSTSPSGNIHGMPVAFLLGMVGEDVPGLEWMKDLPKLDPKRICYVGLRHIDFHEKENIVKAGIKAFSLHEVDKYGIGKVMDMVMEHLGENTPIHLSFDIDAIDPIVCPSTGTRVAGGLTYREACFVCETLSASQRLVSMDITEFNPNIGTFSHVNQTCDVSLSLLRCAFGHNILNVQL
jgi:arginase